MRVLIGVILLLSAAASTSAQTAPQWTIRLTHREERLRDERVRATTELNAVRRLGRGAVGADVSWIDEPGRGSIGVGAEVYTPLWRTAESRFRVFSASRALSAPNLLLAAEVIQHLRAGWELSFSGDDRQYDAGRVNVILAGAGWSSHQWFIRGRAGAIHTDARTMATANALVRRFAADRRKYVQVAAGVGGDVLDFADPTGATPLITVQSVSGAVEVLYPATESLGVTAGVGVAHYESFGTRIVLEAGIALFVGAHKAR
jgi:YaiO family outer membrane protein